MNVTELIQIIRNIVNEASTVNDAFSQETDQAITAAIQSAATMMASMPTYRGEAVTLAGNDAVTFRQRPDGLSYATVRMPADALRPVSIHIEGWALPVYQFLTVANPKFLAQYASAKGIGAGPASPVAFIANDGGTQIIAHAVKQEGTCTVKYIPVPVIQNGELSMPDIYREALAYNAAGLYMQSVNEYDAAKTAFDTAAAYIQNINHEKSEE